VLPGSVLHAQVLHGQVLQVPRLGLLDPESGLHALLPPSQPGAGKRVQAQLLHCEHLLQQPLPYSLQAGADFPPQPGPAQVLPGR
jgi:hypothetical protein